MDVGVGGSLLLVAGGAVAGVVGTAGGITSLVSYPALLAAGVAPLAADVANLVALVAGWPSVAFASRRELVGSAPVLRAGLPAVAVGAAAGSVLLLTTPAGVFADVVPWLVLLGAAVLAAEPLLAARLRRKGETGRHGSWLGWTAVVSVYGGYFGAGSGIMLLATVLVLVEPRVPRANALKNMMVGGSALVSAIVFVLVRPVAWGAVAPLAGGLVVGSLVGPVVARRLPPAVVRWGAVALGVALAVDLWV